MGSQNRPSGDLYDNVQSLHTNEQAIPKGSLLLGVLRSVENELRRRGMLGGRPETSNGETSTLRREGRNPECSGMSDEITPLWFLAETERNVFLWRRGKSLDDQRDYEFWVDIPALLKKRRAQLKAPNGLNPFINPMWGSAPLDQTLVDREQSYLEDMEALLGTVLPHAEALSHASRMVREELDPTTAGKERVVLPAQVGPR